MGTILLGISVYIKATSFSSNEHLRETKIPYIGTDGCHFNSPIKYDILYRSDWRRTWISV